MNVHLLVYFFSSRKSTFDLGIDNVVFINEEKEVFFSVEVYFSSNSLLNVSPNAGRTHVTALFFPTGVHTSD